MGTGRRVRAGKAGVIATLVALTAGSVLTATASPAQPPDQVSPSNEVDPLIGSANGGNTYPGAVLPHGMIAWSPTSTKGDQTDTGAANGYSYDVTRIRGFSLTHINGAGCHPGDRKSTRLNSSHVKISYAV